MARRLIPLLDRVLVEKIIAPTKTAGGILLPETASSKVWLLERSSQVVPFRGWFSPQHAIIGHVQARCGCSIVSLRCGAPFAQPAAHMQPPLQLLAAYQQCCAHLKTLLKPAAQMPVFARPVCCRDYVKPAYAEPCLPSAPLPLLFILNAPNILTAIATSRRSTRVLC